MQHYIVSSRYYWIFHIKRRLFGWLYHEDSLDKILIPWIIVSLAISLVPFHLWHVIAVFLLLFYGFFYLKISTEKDCSDLIRPYWMEQLRTPALVRLWILVTYSAWRTGVSFITGSAPSYERLVDLEKGIVIPSTMFYIWKIGAWGIVIISILFSIQFAWWVRWKPILIVAIMLVPVQLWVWTNRISHGLIF